MVYLFLADPLPAAPISADVLVCKHIHIHADTVVEITIADL